MNSKNFDVSQKNFGTTGFVGSDQNYVGSDQNSATNEFTYQSESCSMRLPCGVCMMLNKMCPLTWPITNLSKINLNYETTCNVQEDNVKGEYSNENNG